MRPSDMTHHDGEEILAAVVRLLSRAADQASEQTAAEPHLGMAALGLGAQLAASEALRLLPEDAAVDEPVPPQNDPLELVRAAGALSRTVRIEVLPPGASQVLAAIHDLIGEHGG